MRECWNGIQKRADGIDFHALLEEKLGHSTEISYDDWVEDSHYGYLDEEMCRFLYMQEKGYIASLEGVTLKAIAGKRISEFTAALKKYIIV